MSEALRLPGWIAPPAALAAFGGEPWTLLLMGSGADGRGRYSYLCAEPDFTIIDDDPQRGFARLRKGFRPGASDGGGFSGGYAGLLSYDLGQAFEAVPPLPPGLTAWPVLAMGWYPAAARFDHVTGEVMVRGEARAARRLARRLEQAGSYDPAPAPGGALAPVWSEARYLEAVRRARAYVAAGDVFQVNLSHPWRGHMAGGDAPERLIARLAQASPAPFAAYLRLDTDRAVASNSPERFITLGSDGRVETRPVKGTRPRRAEPDEDAAEAAALAASDKDRAENLMIVDLMRNDLARVCAPGSVRAGALFQAEAFANVHHLVSSVEGRLARGRDVFDLIAASFPPGSITGAPKTRAMEIIAELEAESRGPYCGAMGWIGVDGAADFNVMIRTAALLRRESGWDVEVRSGGAVTIGSDPHGELAETRDKASALKQAVETA
ncbi:anthranilate synthase component I family protein [Alkalicaulis satelles]|uniref:anthranilate synthase component I family protein n=1 Tax=Alkalicaulis satelles TaxID=2609175 RepID=UPI001E47A36D|nr:anthranilate synthase component I family protein [Alkalicaulis satelles]